MDHAGGDRRDQVVVARHGEHGAGHRGRHPAGAAPLRAGCAERRQQVDADAERGQRRFPRPSGALVEQAGPGDERDLAVAITTEGVSDVLGHVEPGEPGQVEPAGPQVQQLGEGRQRRSPAGPWPRGTPRAGLPAARRTGPSPAGRTRRAPEPRPGRRRRGGLPTRPSRRCRWRSTGRPESSASSSTSSAETLREQLRRRWSRCRRPAGCATAWAGAPSRGARRRVRARSP